MLTSKNLKLFLSNNKKLIIILALYLCFIDLWEDLFNDYIVILVLSKFACNNISTFIFFIAVLVIVFTGYNFHKKGKAISDAMLGAAMAILCIWAWYRFTTQTAYPIEFAQQICYVDILPILSITVILLYFLKKSSQNKTETDVSGFEIDAPIRKDTEDILNYQIHAQDIVHKLMATDRKNGAFTFGIVAPWGGGKTSLMNLMTNYLQNKFKGQAIVLSFNPWIYRKDSNLTQIFFQELIKCLSPYNYSISKNISTYIDKLSGINNTWMQVITFLFHEKSSLDEIKNNIEDDINKIDRKIFVFIDDIDRLNCNEIEEIFNLVRNTSDFPHMYFIMAYDKTYVVDMLNTDFSNHSISFTDKILQAEFHLPQTNQAQIKAFILNKIADKIPKSQLPNLQDLLDLNANHSLDCMKYFHTLREAKRFVNEFSFNIRDIYGDINACDYFILELFKLKYPLVFEVFLEHKDKILEEKDNKYIYSGSKEITDNKEMGTDFIHHFYLVDYCSNHQTALHITKTDIGNITSFLDALFGSLKGKEFYSINNPIYTNRYFNFSLIYSEISEKDFHKCYQHSFMEMMPQLQTWMINKSYYLIQRLEDIMPQDKEGIYKHLHILFYLGALPYKDKPSIPYIAQLLYSLKSYNYKDHTYTEKDKQELYSCLTENGINSFQIDYLFHLFSDSGYAGVLDEKDVINLQNKIFTTYIQEKNHTYPDVLHTWYFTAHKKIITEANNYRHPEYLHEKESNHSMKEYTLRHILEAVPSFIQCSPYEKRYSLIEAIQQLWGSYDNFYTDVKATESNDPLLTEFKDFLTQLKNESYNFVFYEFKYIKLNN